MMSGAAGFLSTSFGSSPSLWVAVPPTTEPLIHRLTPDLRLYGATATAIVGNAKLDNLKISVNCKDSSKLKWNVSAPEEGSTNFSFHLLFPPQTFTWKSCLAQVRLNRI